MLKQKVFLVLNIIFILLINVKMPTIQLSLKKLFITLRPVSRFEGGGGSFLTAGWNKKNYPTFQESACMG